MGDHKEEEIPMSDQKKSLEERLTDYPELKERFEAILAIAEAEGNDLRTADDAEQRAIEEVRKLGNEIMHAWGRSRENQNVAKLREEGEKLTKHGRKTLHLNLYLVRLLITIVLPRQRVYVQAVVAVLHYRIIHNQNAYLSHRKRRLRRLAKLGGVGDSDKTSL